MLRVVRMRRKAYMEQICCFPLFVCTKFAIPIFIFIGPCKWYTNRCAENLNTCITKLYENKNELEFCASIHMPSSNFICVYVCLSLSLGVCVFIACACGFQWILFHFISLVFRSSNFQCKRPIAFIC